MQVNALPDQKILIHTNSKFCPLCSTFTTFSTSDEISPGLVLNGTRCGNEMVSVFPTYYNMTSFYSSCLYLKLCMNHRCVPVSNLSTSPCPVGSNAAVCSANGVCNMQLLLRQRHCLYLIYSGMQQPQPVFL